MPVLSVHRWDGPQGVWQGSGSVSLAQGVLTPGALLAWPDCAIFDATFASFRRWRLQRTSRISLFGRARSFPTLGRPEWAHGDLADLIVADELGTRYSPCRMTSLSFGRRFSGEPGAPADLEVRLDPPPPAEASWVELRGPDGSVARLVRGRRVPSRNHSTVAPQASPAEREIEALARSALAFTLFGAKANHPDFARQQGAQLRALVTNDQSSPASALNESLVRDIHALASVLEGDDGTARLPPRWRRLLDAREQRDGPSLQLNIGTRLPRFDGIDLALGALVLEPSLWRLSVTAAPGWWQDGEKARQERAQIDVWAEDDCDGLYVAMLDRLTSVEGGDNLVLRFRPRLDPATKYVRLTFAGAETLLKAEIGLRD